MADEFEKIGVEAVIEGLSAFTQNANVITDSLLAIGNIAMDALGDLASTAFEAMVSGALESEQTLTRLQSVITSTGGAAGLTLTQAQDLATQFMDLAGGSDDAVLAIEEMALRMGTVSADEMPAFIQTTLDLAAVTGVDAVNAARLLAQAQEDPISTLSRLQKQGILFTDEQKEQIKTLQESGDTAGATALVMDRLAEATSGAALANSQTLTGQWEIFTGRMGEAAEAVGVMFLPIAHELFDEVIAPAIPLVEDFAAMIAEHIPPAIEAAQAVFETLVGTLQDDFLPQFQPIIDAVLNVADAFMDSMPLVWNAVQEAFSAVQGILDAYLPQIIANVTGALTALAEFWRAHGDEVITLVTVAFEAVAGLIGATLTVITGLVTAGLEAISGIWDFWSAVLSGDFETAGQVWIETFFNVWQTIQSTFETVFNAILGVMGTDLETLRTTWQANLDNLILIVTTVGTNIAVAFSTMMLNAIATVQNTITDFGTVGAAIVEGLISGVSGMAQSLINSVTGVIDSAIGAAKALLGIHSPSLVFTEIGENIGAGLIEGLQASAEQVSEAMEGLFDLGGSFSSIGGGFAGLFKKQTVAPLKDFVKAMDKTVTTLEKSLEKSFGKDGAGRLQQLIGFSETELAAARFGDVGYQGFTEEQIRLAEQLRAAREKTAEATAQLAAEEAHLTELQKQQDNLKFLEQQVKLLDLIRENDLDAGSILGGLSLGLDASLPGLIDAMSRAVGAIVAQTNAGVTNYNYAPTYGSSPQNPSTDFLLMQTLAG